MHTETICPLLYNLLITPALVPTLCRASSPFKEHLLSTKKKKVSHFKSHLISHLTGFLWPPVLFQFKRLGFLRHLRRPLPAKQPQQVPDNAWREKGRDPVRLRGASQGEGRGAGAAVPPGNLVRSHPSHLPACPWHAVPSWHVVHRHRLGEHQRRR